MKLGANPVLFGGYDMETAFKYIQMAGYDGIEVMVSLDASSQDLAVLRRLSDYHEMPIRSIHAPCLLLTQRVWGREPWEKLRRAKDLAERVGARVVVVHPPFRWQREYAKDFTQGLARMAEYVEAGASKFILRPAARGDDDMLDQTRRLIEQVLPLVAARWPKQAKAA